MSMFSVINPKLNQVIPAKLKISIFKTLVVSILLYGCEAWTISPMYSSKINSFGTSCLRRIIGVQRLDKITNIEIYRRTGEKQLMNQVRKRQLGWLGHVLRRPTKFEPSRTFALYEPTHGSAKRGRKKLSYAKQIAGMLFENPDVITTKDITGKATDRKQWTKIVADCSNAAP